jgi:para-nitrobenzyl esterase
MSEDCLRLNIWTAGLAPADRRPVMVFLHGGGYQTGSGNSVLYDGTNLAKKQGVVLVTVNHRLNALGYLHLADLAGEGFASNVGLLDIVAGLEWVQDNIARFGGDPDRVTLFGESGGAAKTCMLMAMPAAKGLFHRAIVQSTLVDMALRGHPREEGTRLAALLLARLGLKASQASELRSLPVERIIDAQVGGPSTPRGAGDDGRYVATSFYPVVDGRVLPSHPFDPVAPAESAGVPLLCGSTEHELTPYLDAAMLEPIDDAAFQERVKGILRVDDATARRVIALYRRNRPRAGNADLAAIMTSDNSVMRLSEQRLAERKARQAAAPVFLYYFQWPSPVRNGRLGAMHGIELPFVFDNTEKVPHMVGTGPELAALADRVSATWAAFARSGVPEGPGLPAWPRFNPKDRQTMVFNVESQVVNDPYGEERLVLEAIREAQASLPPFNPPGCPSIACVSR